jgi:hypothetical protein
MHQRAIVLLHVRLSDAEVLALLAHLRTDHQLAGLARP